MGSSEVAVHKKPEREASSDLHTRGGGEKKLDVVDSVRVAIL